MHMCKGVNEERFELIMTYTSNINMEYNNLHSSDVESGEICGISRIPLMMANGIVTGDLPAPEIAHVV